MNIQEFRKQYPMYQGYSDTQLADALYQTHYNAYDRTAFDQAFLTVAPPEAPAPTVPEEEPQGDISQALESGFDRIGTVGTILGQELGLLEPSTVAERLLDPAIQPEYTPETQAELQEIQESEGLGTIYTALANPTGLMVFLAENAPQALASIPSAIVGGIAGKLVGGPVGATAGLMVGSSLPSFAMEYGNTIREEIEKRGITTPEDVEALLGDEEFMAAARERGVKRGVPIAAFDALSMGLAGKAFGLASKVATSTAGRIAVGAPAEIAMQSTAAALGETGAQLAADEKITSTRDIALEGLLSGIIGTPAEFIAAGITRGKPAVKDGDPEADPAADPGTSPEARPVETPITQDFELELGRFIAESTERPKLLAAAEALRDDATLSPQQKQMAFLALADLSVISPGDATDPTITFQDLSATGSKGAFLADIGEVRIDPRKNSRAAMHHELEHFHRKLLETGAKDVHDVWYGSFKSAATLEQALSGPVKKAINNPELIKQASADLEARGVEITAREASAYAVEIWGQSLATRSQQKTSLTRGFNFFANALDRMGARARGRKTQLELLEEQETGGIARMAFDAQPESARSTPPKAPPPAAPPTVTTPPPAAPSPVTPSPVTPPPVTPTPSVTSTDLTPGEGVEAVSVAPEEAPAVVAPAPVETPAVVAPVSAEPAGLSWQADLIPMAEEAGYDGAAISNLQDEIASSFPDAPQYFAKFNAEQRQAFADAISPSVEAVPETVSTEPVGPVEAAPEPVAPSVPPTTDPQPAAITEKSFKRKAAYKTPDGDAVSLANVNGTQVAIMSRPGMAASQNQWWVLDNQDRSPALIEAGYDYDLLPESMQRRSVVYEDAASPGTPPIPLGSTRREAASSIATMQAEDGGTAVAPEPVGPLVPAITPAGTQVDVTYEVRELGDLIPSQTDELTANPAYLSELQPRERTRAASQEQISRIARNLNPEQLVEAPTTDQGAPVIGLDDMVESGNGRILAIRKAARDTPGLYDRYKERLVSGGYDIANFSQPVLVRVNRSNTTPDQRAAFVRESNQRTTLGMSTSELARSDASVMSQDLLRTYVPGDTNSLDNSAFRAKFFSEVIGEADAAQYQTETGGLNADGKRRIDAALVQFAYQDDTIVNEYFEALDTDRMSVGAVLRDNAARWAALRSEADLGNIDPLMDTTDGLKGALNLIRRSRAEGRNIQEYMDQADAFTGTMSEIETAWVKTFFKEDMSRMASQKVMGERFKYYMDEADKSSAGPDLLGDKPSPEQILAAALKDRSAPKHAKEQDNLFPPAVPIAVEASVAIEQADTTTVPLDEGNITPEEFSLDIRDFVPSSGGKIYFGRGINKNEASMITRFMPGSWAAGGRVVYPLGRAGRGADMATNYGQAHVRSRGHIEELQSLGFKDDVDALEYVTSRHTGLVMQSNNKGLLQAIKRIGSRDYKINAIVKPIISPQDRRTYLPVITIYSPDVAAASVSRPDPTLVNAEFSASIDPRTTQAADKVHAKVPVVSVLRRLMDAGSIFNRERWTQQLLDRYYPIAQLEMKKFGKLQPGAVSPYKMTRIAHDVGGLVTHFLKFGQATYTNDGWIPIADKKGMLEIFRPLAKKYGDLGTHLWGAYAYAVRAQRFIAEGREKLLSQGEITRLLDLGRQFPEFEAARLEWVDFNSNVVQQGVNSGYLDQETADLWMSYGDFVPFYRHLDPEGQQGRPSGDSVGGLGRVGAPSRRLRGSNAPINNVLDNMVKNTEFLLGSMMKNRAMTLFVDEYGPQATGFEVLEEVSGQTGVMALTTPEAIKSALAKSLGADHPLIEDVKSMKNMQKIFTLTPREQREANIVHVRGIKRGQQELGKEPEFGTTYYKVKDDHLFEAMSTLAPLGGAKFWRAMGIQKNVFSRMITMMPDFMGVNLVRDTMSTRQFFGGYEPLTGVIRGMKSSLTNDAVQQELRLNGGLAIGGFYGNDVARFKALTGSKSNPLIATPMMAYNILDKIGQATEQSNRTSVYRAGREKGLTGFESAFRSKSIIDFGLTGSSTVVRALIQTVPFLNARMQGLYALGRSGADAINQKQNRLNFFGMGMLYAGLSTALYLMNRDDERFKEEDDVSRNGYIHLWLDKIPGLEHIEWDNPHIAIPKPFELGALFMTLPERLMEQAVDDEKDGEDFAKVMRQVLEGTFKISPLELGGPYLKGVLQDVFNYDTFTGRKIVPTYQQDLRGSDEEFAATVSERTGESINAIAESLNMNPRRVQALMDSFFPKVGRLVMTAADMYMRHADGKPPLAKEFEDSFAGKISTGRFRPKNMAGFGQSEKALMELNGEIKAYRRAVSNTEKLAAKGNKRGERLADKLYEDGIIKDEFRPEVNAAVVELKEISLEINDIRDDTSMSEREKIVAIRELSRERARIARPIVEAYNKAVKK